MAALIAVSSMVLVSLAVFSDVSEAETEEDYNSYYYNRANLMDHSAQLQYMYNKFLEYDTPSDGPVTVVLTFDVQVDQSLVNSIPVAMRMITLDHPEYFWMNIYDVSYKYDTANRKVSVTFQPSEYLGGKTISGAEQRDNALSAINAIIDSWNIKDSYSDVKKVEMINDGLTKLLNHGPSGTSGNLYRNIISAFLSDDHKGVCVGYSYSFKYCCDRLGIPCISVVGDYTDPKGDTGAHMWNYVRVDGVWYQADELHNDNGTCNLEKLLLGTDHIAGYAPDLDYNGSPDPSALYPVLSETSHYIFTIKFVDWDGTVISEEKYYAGEDVQKHKDPSREGYTFRYWKGWAASSYHYATSDATYTAVYVGGDGDSSASGGMCGSTVAMILIAAFSVAAVPCIRFLRG